MTPATSALVRDLHVRAASPGDAARIAAIYAHHVLHGTATFELVPPDAAEIARRHTAVVASGFPWLVATLGGEVAGYAYATHHRTRPAYAWTAEDSIYLDPGATGRGIGRVLLGRLLALCEAQGVRQMIAVIGDSANMPSIALHRALGFVDAGVQRAVGLKFGRWLDTVTLQRALGEGAASIPSSPPARAMPPS